MDSIRMAYWIGRLSGFIKYLGYDSTTAYGVDDAEALLAELNAEWEKAYGGKI